MSTTQNRLLKQCKMKFRNCYKLNDGVPNIPVFVDRFMGKIQIGRLSVDGLAHLSGQLMLLAVLAAGLGACAAIIDGKTVGEIFPFYLMSFLGLYLYFSVSGLVDLEGKKEDGRRGGGTLSQGPEGRRKMSGMRRYHGKKDKIVLVEGRKKRP